MEDANADNQGTNRASIRSTVGRQTGNFKIDEDMKLASAYVFVTTNAAIGTDQDGETYWKKIRDSFIKGGGLATRTLLSLKNRFNKVLQAEVNKYVGYLHSALREFHSGWSMIDYTTKAKAEFQTKQGKMFKHDIVYDILKRTLPKYEISLDTIHPRVARALALLDNDNERAMERDAIRVAAVFPVANITALLNSSVDSNDENSNVLVDKSNIVEAEPAMSAADDDAAPDDDARTSAANSGFRRAVLHADLSMTPRPSIGKKKAKVIAQQQAASANKRLKVQLPSARFDSNKVSLERLASAAETKNQVGMRMALAVEAKNGIAKEQLMMQLFLANPQSPDEDVPVSFNNDDDDEPEDFGLLPDTQKLVGCLLDAAAATSMNDNEEKDDDDDDYEDETYFNARKWLEKNTPPVIDLTMIRGSDFSDDEKENDAPIPLMVKVKVEAMEEEETQWTALDNHA
ncbi:No apical meristem-associated C-terminal domain [Fragilaria crotonensis]|nr:No apical meristem-associated C-terminal domain [Fragilaria crotonensis]